jgi:NADPH-dependent curcumin reductase CurA
MRIIGKVIASKNEAWKVGDLLGGSLPYSTIQIITANDLKKTLVWKLTDYISEAEISLGVGILGTNL